MKIVVLGTNGRMGRIISAEATMAGHTVVAAGRAEPKEKIFAESDAIIDFTVPDSVIEHAGLAHQHQKPYVIGTTGLGKIEMAALSSASIRAPVLHSGNMSLGVNLLLSLVEQAARKLGPDFDIEIFEAHHKNKADAPSGTALMLGETAAAARGTTLKDAMIPARFGQTGPRIPGSIGISVFRGGDVIGDHTVTFAGTGERIEISHKASDRSLFAKGAIKAAEWLQGRAPGLYSMRDVLGL